jgi:hypothetical protein
MTCKYLKIGLFNAGSLGTGHDEFTVAMEELDPDILAVNETWLRAGEVGRAPRLGGYRLRHIPRPDHICNGRGGGVGFYIRKGLYARIFCPSHKSDVEQMWLIVRVRGMDVVVGTAYRPPWQVVDTFLDSVAESIVSLPKHDTLVLVGDFNINLLDTSCNKTVTFNRFISSLNIKQVVEVPTHFTDHSETLIDVVCTDARVLQVKVKHSPELGGHGMIVAELKVKRDRPHPRWVTFRPLKDVVLDLFNNDLNAICWENLIKMDNTDHMVEAFTQCIASLFDLHAPTKKRRFRHPPHPWITDTIKSMIQLRDRSHKKYKKYGTEALKNSYKTMKRLVVVAMEKEKKCFFNKHINNNIYDSKKLWHSLKKSMSVENKNNTELPPNFNNPDHINLHFLNVPGEEIVSISHLTSFEYNRFHSGIFTLQTVSELTVLKTIRGLKSNAQGDDGLSLDMLLLTLPQSLGAITAIINSSITLGVFPQRWKVAVVKPLPKCESPTSISDLRPISLLPCLSKVLERIVCGQMTKYLEANSILPSLQSGFRKGHGTATALCDVVDNLLAAQDRGQVSALLLLDFSRAFDSINTALLLSKLAYYGFDMNAISWFHSYLGDRGQYVELVAPDGSRSHSVQMPVKRGVPQGSILGPILYSLYSADIVKGITHCRYHLYADDLQLYYSFAPSDLSDAEVKINSDLRRLENWCQSNCLALNPKKSKLLVVGTKRKLQTCEEKPLNILIHNEKVEQVHTIRNLGLTLDARLNFDSHIVKCARSCFYKLKLLYKIKPYLSQNIKTLLCESLILSKFNYCDSVYGPCLLVRTAKLIQRVQNACARFCFEVPPRAHVTPFLNSDNIVKMEARRRLHLATLLFGVINTGRPRYLLDKLVWTETYCSYGRRSCTRVFATPQHRTVAFRGSFRFAATRCWNDLPPPVRELKGIKAFKKAVKNILLTEQKESYLP